MSGQLVAVDTTLQSVTALFPLGTLHVDNLGNHFRYMQAEGAVTKNLLYTYDNDVWAVDAPLTTTVAASGEIHPLCASPVAMTDNYYAWVFVGPGRVTLTAATALAIVAQAKIYTSAVAGMVDDDASGEILIPGLVSYDAIATAATGTFMASIGLYVSN